MREALAEAELGRGRTHPNPCVGAVVVRGGRVIGRGHHERAGGPHAEVMALRRAGERARGAELYVTLEPCNHRGRTPPCTDAILAAGVGRVFFGSKDPNPSVPGNGGERLRRAGVRVTSGVLKGDCDRANAHWMKFITRGIPWVLLKAAITLDGKIATASGDARWVSGEKSRHIGHRLRDEMDAVLVGVGTALADDPRLTARGAFRGVPARDPVRVVVDSRARLPPAARMLRQRSHAPTLVAVTERATARRCSALERAGARIVRCRARKDGRVELAQLLELLAREGLTSVLVEGGSAIHGAFLEAELWDELYLFVAPKLAGSSGLSWAGLDGVRSMREALALPPFRAVSAEAAPDLWLQMRRQPVL